MSNWTSQQGYPVLKITSQDTEKGTITLRQSVFLLDKKSGEKPELWSIPVTVASSSGKTVYSGIISEQEETIQLEKEEDRRWINVNPNQIGFYRVQYPKEMIQSFVPAIRDRTMPLDDRLGLIYDQLALVEAGMESADELLELLGEYREEDHGLVWEAIVTCLDKIGAMLDEDSKAKAALNTWTRWLLKPAMARLGWQAQPDEGHIQGMFRSTIVRTLIGAGDEEVIKDGTEKFKKGQDVHADLKSSTFRAVLISEGRSAWDKLTKIAGETDNAEEQARIYAALGSCQSADLVQETLNFAMSDKVRSQDTRSVFVSVSSGSTQGRNLAWAFFKAQKAEIAARYKVGGLLVGLVNAVLERFATEEMALEVESFFRENPFPGAERGIKQCLEKIRLRAEWKDRDMEQLKTYLDNKIAKFD